MSEAVKNALASGEWTERKDPKTGKTYYTHKVTKKTTWNLEKELADVAIPAAATVADVLAQGEWAEKKDPKSGKSYYVNKTTKKTTWDLAKELGLPGGKVEGSETPTRTSDDAAVRTALAAGEWAERKDPKTGKSYFVNNTTKKTTWDLAKELASTGQVGKSVGVAKCKRSYSVADALKSGEWRETTDFTGEKYYVNTVTGRTTADLKLFLEIEEAIDEGGITSEDVATDAAGGAQDLNDWVSVMLHAPGHPAAAERIVAPFLDESVITARAAANTALAAQVKDMQEIAALRTRNAELEAALVAHQKEIHQLQCAVFYGIGSLAKGYTPAGLDPLHANSTIEPTSLMVRVQELERLVATLQSHNRALQLQLDTAQKDSHHAAVSCRECSESDPWRRLLSVATVTGRRTL